MEGQLLGFVLGIALAAIYPGIPDLYVAVVVLGVGLVAFAAGRRSLAAACCGALFMVQALWSAASALLPDVWDGREVVVQGEVSSLPQRGEALRFDLTVANGELSGRVVRVGWYNAQPLGALAGAHCRLRVKLRLPRNHANPGAFDFERWAFRRGIASMATVRASRYNRCEAAHRVSVLTVRERLRDRMLQLELSHGAELIALALGDGSGIADADWQLFRVTGTVHLIVISGLHVTLLAGFAFMVFGALARVVPPLLARFGALPAAALGALSVVWLYASLCGMGVAVVRAALMASVMMLALLMQRRVLWWPMLLWVMTLQLLLGPLAIYELGFWLSLGAVAVLLWTGHALLELPSWGTRVLALTWARVQWRMLLTMTPLLLAAFGSAPLLGWVANLLIGPLLSLVVVPLALAGCLLAPWTAAGADVLWLANVVIDVLWALLRYIEPAAKAAMWQPAAPWWLIAVPCWSLLLPSQVVPHRLCLAVLLAAAVIPHAQRVAPGQLEVLILDVGQGSAALVDTHSQRLLIDAGPKFGDGFDAGASVIPAALANTGPSRLDTLVITHADRDHAGGLAALMSTVSAGVVYAPHAGATPGFVSRRCRAGDGWVRDGVRFEFLWPNDLLWPKENDRSCVLLISGHDYRVLVTGDISSAVERRLATTKIDLLVAPHHGSKHSSSSAWLRRLHVDDVAFSAGYRNHFGHPHRDVLLRVHEAGGRSWSTAQSGALLWQSSNRIISGWRCQFEPRLPTAAPCSAPLL